MSEYKLDCVHTYTERDTYYTTVGYLFKGSDGRRIVCTVVSNNSTGAHLTMVCLDDLGWMSLGEFRSVSQAAHAALLTFIE